MPPSSDSFPRGRCLFSLPSILIGNWSCCWRKLEFPPPPLCPWNTEPQKTWREGAKETTSTPPHPLQRDHQASHPRAICVPHGTQGDPIVATRWNPVLHPHSQALTLQTIVTLLQKPLSLHRGRNRTHLLDSTSCHKCLCHQDRYLFSFSLSSFFSFYCYNLFSCSLLRSWRHVSPAHSV